MGYELWIDRDLAWARGTYEYRPMGAAVIAASDLFRARDGIEGIEALVVPTAPAAQATEPVQTPSRTVSSGPASGRASETSSASCRPRASHPPNWLAQVRP